MEEMGQVEEAEAENEAGEEGDCEIDEEDTVRYIKPEELETEIERLRSTEIVVLPSSRHVFPSQRAVLVHIHAFARQQGFTVWRQSGKAGLHRMFCSHGRRGLSKYCDYRITAESDDNGNWRIVSASTEHNHSILNPYLPDSANGAADSDTSDIIDDEDGRRSESGTDRSNMGLTRSTRKRRFAELASSLADSPNQGRESKTSRKAQINIEESPLKRQRKSSAAEDVRKSSQVKPALYDRKTQNQLSRAPSNTSETLSSRKSKLDTVTELPENTTSPSRTAETAIDHERQQGSSHYSRIETSSLHSPRTRNRARNSAPHSPSTSTFFGWLPMFFCNIVKTALKFWPKSSATIKHRTPSTVTAKGMKLVASFQSLRLKKALFHAQNGLSTPDRNHLRIAQSLQVGRHGKSGYL
ncbi:hypothetical protein JCM5353_000334 [Sporobolomyces roseus]